MPVFSVSTTIRITREPIKIVKCPTSSAKIQPTGAETMRRNTSCRNARSWRMRCRQADIELRNAFQRRIQITLSLRLKLLAKYLKRFRHFTDLDAASDQSFTSEDDVSTCTNLGTRSSFAVRQNLR